MEIRINNKLAYLKEKTSFDFISENSMFTGSDSYTLSITFPLRDCPQNTAIFGRIHRQDVEKDKVVFDCDIRDKNFFKSGSITVTEISEVEVKTQFLEGRSEQNFNDTFDNVYLNSLSLGYAPNVLTANSHIPDDWRPYPENNFVPLPWVNNTSGNLQNEAKYDSSTRQWSWNLYSSNSRLTFQPYLLYILEKICQCVGYTYDFDEIRQSNYKYLLICNTLPYTWAAWNFAIALPHWSLTEFFEQLELFLYGEFTINHKAKHISFAFTTKLVKATKPVYIHNVVNEYTTEVSQEEESDYLGVKNIAYAENGNRFWAYRSCEWYIREHKEEAVVYEHLADLMNFAKTLKLSGYYRTDTARGFRELYSRGYPPGSDGHKLFYAKDVDTYFIMFCYDAKLLNESSVGGNTYHWYQYYNRLEPINQFGKRIVDRDADDIELKIVPAWIDDTDDEHGPCLFLECGEMGSAVQWTDVTDDNGNTSGGFTGGSGGGSFGGRRAPAKAGSFGGSRSGSGTSSSDYDDTDYDSGELAQSKVGRAIAKGEQDKADAYFDNIYMAYWDGYMLFQGKQPCPIIDSIMVSNDFTWVEAPYSLRLNHPTPEVNRAAMYEIDGKKKYNFSFLLGESEDIPDTRNIFHIKGSRYLCEKLTMRFTEKGRSQMIKGVFYRLVD